MLPTRRFVAGIVGLPRFVCNGTKVVRVSNRVSDFAWVGHAFFARSGSRILRGVVNGLCGIDAEFRPGAGSCLLMDRASAEAFS
jgi:hypothetical protein